VLPAVSDAIQEIRTNFPDATLVVKEDGEGGAYVILEDLEMPASCTPRTSWVGFRITYTYPIADVYPHYVRSDLKRADGTQLPAVSPTTWYDRAALQVSRKSNRWNPATDTALLKLLKILQWLEAPA
jgi:hypothetical protein